MGWRFAAPEPGAWLAARDHPAIPYPGNRGLINRLLVICAVDLMMHDQMHDRGQGRRSDWLGGTTIWLSYTASPPFFWPGRRWRRTGNLSPKSSTA